MQLGPASQVRRHHHIYASQAWAAPDRSVAGEVEEGELSPSLMSWRRRLHVQSWLAAPLVSRCQGPGALVTKLDKSSWLEG